MGQLQKINSMMSKKGQELWIYRVDLISAWKKTRKASWRKWKGKSGVSFEWQVEISQENCKWEQKGEEVITGKGTVCVRAQGTKDHSFLGTEASSPGLKHRIYTDEERVWHLHWKQGILKALGVIYKF